jgi:hypothetical protein
MKCPPFAKTMVLADDAKLAAQLSSLCMTPGAYLAVVDGPRITRPDRWAEAIRRHNAVARVRPDRLLLAGVSEEASKVLDDQFGKNWPVKVRRVASINDIADHPRSAAKTLTWGSNRIGAGLLTALRNKLTLAFSDRPSLESFVPPKWGHLVVCEEGDELSEVIAANYAYSLRAGLATIPDVPENTRERLLDAFYSVDDDPSRPRQVKLKELQSQLRELCGTLCLQDVNSITFVTGGLPFGFAFPEKPTTHLFKSPDLGVSIINGFTAEQSDRQGSGVAAIIDPGTVPAPEVEAAVDQLARRGAFVRCYYGNQATVRDASDAIELFPYEFLLIATHCGDAKGYRWTYEYRDSEGHDRRLVVDIALGVARTDKEDVLHVTQFRRFVSLDGVDWQDPEKEDKLYVGTAINDYLDRTRSNGVDKLEPVLREEIDRVRWSAAMKMYDHNYLTLDQSIAETGTPIIMNNACGSWHRLGGTFTFSGARAYIGTLFPVMGVEAQEVTNRLLGALFGSPLPDALWRAQREVHSDTERRPYVIVGAYPQRLRSFKHDVPRYLARRLSSALRDWQEHLEKMPAGYVRERVESNIKYYTDELAAVLDVWPKALDGKAGRTDPRR